MRDERKKGQSLFDGRRATTGAVVEESQFGRELCPSGHCHRVVCSIPKPVRPILPRKIHEPIEKFEVVAQSKKKRDEEQCLDREILSHSLKFSHKS